MPRRDSLQLRGYRGLPRSRCPTTYRLSASQRALKEDASCRTSRQHRGREKRQNKGDTVAPDAVSCARQIGGLMDELSLSGKGLAAAGGFSVSRVAELRQVGEQPAS